jgi:hypothetical protein
MIHFVVPEPQAFSVREYLAVWGEPISSRMQVTFYHDLPNLTIAAPGTWVFAALDQLSPPMRALTTSICTQLLEAGARVLNDPSSTLFRFPLLQALHHRGLNDFRATRATDPIGELRYPVFLRDERSHGGPLSPLLHSPGEVSREIGRALVRGRRMRDLILIEYCDTADVDGCYRKYSAFAVGSAVIPRSVAYGHRWMLKHHGTEYSRGMVEEEREYVIGNPHEQELAEIFALARVEYGRIDYALKEGAIRTWEINLNPTIGRGTRPPSGRIPLEFEPIRQESKEHFYRRFREAWESVDVEAGGAMPLTLHLDSRLRREARHDSAPPRPMFQGFRAALRPFRPLLDPIARRLFPEIGRLAQRGPRGTG